MDNVVPFLGNATPFKFHAIVGDEGGGGGGGGDAGDAGDGDGDAGDAGDTGDAGAGDGDGGGTGDTHWMDGLEGLDFNDRDAGVLKRFGDVGALAKGYLNAFNLVGRDKIPMPQTEEEWNEVYDRLGRPKEAGEYNLTVGDDLPQEFKEAMAKNMGWFQDTAHRLGLNAEQAGKLYSEYAGFVHEQATLQNETVIQEMDAAREELKGELGEAYEGKMTLANRAIEELGGEDLISLFERSGMGRNPTVVKAFIKMGEMMGEDVGLDTEGHATETFDQLDEQIAAIQANTAYLDEKAPEHKVLVEKMQKLMQRRHPEPKTAPGTIRLF
jgi:hypothetical protein